MSRTGHSLVRCLPALMAVLVLGLLRLSAEDTLVSAVEGPEHAAVTTASGVFIAPRTGGPWRPIPLPPTMPSPGIVSGNPEPGGALYYHSVRAYRPGPRQGDPAQPLPTHPDWQFGLYRRTPDGLGWNRISDDAGFIQILPLERRLYALTDRPDRPSRRQQILVSTNDGASWQDVAELPSSHGYLQRIFPDPDTPPLPAAFATGIRGTILRLTPDRLRWEESMAHRMTTRFLSAAQVDLSAWANPEAPRVPLRLQNYFQFPSRVRLGSTTVPTAWIGTGGRRQFPRSSDIVVVARIRTGPEFPSSPDRHFVDSGEDHRAWGFQRWTPSGVLEQFPPEGIPKQAKSHIELPVCTSDSDPGILLKLSDRASFQEPGRHRIQLMYDTVESSRGRSSEWAVRLLSEPFEIEVR